MISKEKVLKIIKDFDEIQHEMKQDANNLDNIQALQMSAKKKALNDYINSLSYDEYIDLCALTDIGRDYVQNGNKSMMCDYRVSRKSFENNHKDEKNHASYLLGKSELNTYLRHSIHLYDEEELRF